MAPTPRFFIPALALFALAVGSSRGVASPPPNVIYLLADDLGYGDLGSYGQKRVRTPNFDRLAAEGMRFTQHYAGAPFCAPSRATLMTGRHTGRTFVRALGDHPVQADEPSLGRLFQSAGHATAAFGKWGLGKAGTSGSPAAQGFDRFTGFLDHRSARKYYPRFLDDLEGRVELPQNREGASGRYSHDELADRALAFVRENRDRPFFLYLPFAIPHAELVVPPDSLAEYEGRWEETPFPGGNNGYSPQPQPRAARAGMITRMDRTLGRLLDLLDELDLAERTLVIATSDNGPATGSGQDPEFFDSNGPLRGLKFQLWEGGIRVPFLARWSGTIPAGETTDFVCAAWDMLPTMAELLDVNPPSGLSGVSIASVLRGEEAPQVRPPLYWEAQGEQAIRVGRWKGIRRHPDAPLQLFDLENDIGENEDLAAARPEIVAELERTIEAVRVESARFPLRQE